MADSPAAARGREVRRRLLAGAAELIAERGWSAVSTRVLAERAGVTPSVVHYHFPSLPALLSEAVVDRMREVVAQALELLRTVRTPTEAVEAMLSSVEQYTGTDPGSLLFIEAYLASTRDPELRARIAEVTGEFSRRFGDLLRDRGVAEPERTAAVLIATVDGLLLHRGLGADTDSGSLLAVVRRLVEATGRQ